LIVRFKEEGKSVRAAARARGYPIEEQEAVLEKFVRDENLKLYRRLLSETHDEDRRRVLLQLIASLSDRDGGRRVRS